MKKTLNSRGKERFLLKFDLKMKLTLFVAVVSLFQLKANNSHSRSTKLSVEMDKVTVNDAIREIESLSEFKFLHNRKDVNLDRIVSVKAKKKRISSILSEVFSNTNVGFEVLNKQIILRKKDVISAMKIPNPPKETLDQLTISGTVSDTNGQPLPGASIVVKGAVNGTQTDFDGNFSIEVTDENAVLVVSYIGFASQEIEIGQQRVIAIVLTENAAGLDEVVVVGYGTQNKKDVTGAISTISAEDLGEASNDSFIRTLSGKIAGVQIQQTTGAPGGNIVVRVRGTGSLTAGNDPLYVVDGFPIEQSNLSGNDDNELGSNGSQGINPLSSLNPDDIESIQVLKDASAAAIYGSRGANGVVIIATKKGRSGTSNINFSASIGSSSVINELDLLNGDQYIDFVRDAYVNADATSAPGIAFPLFLNDVSGLQGVNTDWQDQIFRSALIHNYQLSASGGTEKLRYFISGGYTNEEGIVVSSGFERFSLRINLDAQLTDNLKLGANIAPGYTVNDEVNAEGHWAVNAVINSALVSFPFLRPGPDEISGEQFEANDPNYTCCGTPNPVLLASENDINSTQLRLLTNTYLELEILKGLKVKTSFGFDYSDFERNQFIAAAARRFNNQNAVFTNKLGQRNWLTENTFNYNTSFREHKFDVLGGFTYQEFRQQNNRIQAADVSDGPVRTIFDFNTVTRAFNFIEEWSLVSLLGRVQYSFADKYLISAAIRRDGSSRFGANNKFANFPSVSAGWTISEEDFVKGYNDLNFLKLRASWGRTGNNRIGNYSSIALLTNENYVLGSGNGEGVTGLRPESIANPDLTWETTEQYDIGLDLGLFQNRLFFTVDYFNSETKDLLLNVPIPTSSGFGSALQNLGRVKNTGWEFAINSKNFVGHFKWDTDFNITFGDNEILELGPEGDPIRAGSGAGSIFLNEIGGELGAFSVYEQIGIFQTQEEIDNSAVWNTSRGTFPGDVKYKDQNGDGVINSDDRVVIGSNRPDFIWGITNNLHYKNLDLNVVVNGVEGNLIHNVARRFYNNLEGNQNQSADALNRWRSPNQPGDGVTPRANRLTSGNNNVAESSRWVEDGSFVRIQNVTLGYNFPNNITEKMKLGSLRIYASIDNLAYFTDYSGYNPEVSLSGGDPLRTGADYGSYPLSRRWALGIKVGL
ncbi:TonB-dependent receptor [Maribacter sp. 2304DJ31-5]|uniref:TonB-dependent receptor n=1 Tax=Maribacter sp. 2304DJ31-5 TaxID=3386273 RepID=UPI0039BD87E4